MANSFTHIPEDDLSAYIDNALTAEQHRYAETHISACDLCQNALRDLESTVQMLRGLPEINPPRSFRILVERQPSFLDRILTWDMGLRSLAAAAAALFLVLFGTDMMRIGSAPSTATLVSLSQKSEPRTVAAPAAAPPPAAASAPAAGPAGANAARATGRGDESSADTAAAQPKLEPFNPANVSASAAGPLGMLSDWTLAAGGIAVILIAIVVTRTVSRAGPPH